MEFRILGPFEVVRQGTGLPPPAHKPRALLALLLLHGAQQREPSAEEGAEARAGGDAAEANGGMQQGS